jgi:antitoxin component YwqK of YwqJK toxin-antitoxin module
LLVAAVAGCGSEDSDARSPLKVKEVEVTTQSGSTTQVQKFEVKYDGGKIREVLEFVNGAPNGSSKYIYGGWGLEKIDYTDKEGDRASETFSYASNKLMRDRYEITGLMSRERMLKYGENGLPKEITTNLMISTNPAETFLTKYDYDADLRLEKITTLDGSDTSTTELRYDTAGRLERSTSYEGAQHIETYTYAYLADGRIDEVTDTHNGRYAVSYDSANRIEDIRVYGSNSSLTTWRYVYDAGDVEGMTYAPSLPMGGQFDLGGVVYGDVSLMHSGPVSTGDIAKAPTSGTGGIGGMGGTGGGGGGGGTMCGFTPQDACETCLVTSCCSQTTACLTGTACDSFWTCGDACNGDTTCINTCRTNNPSGAAAYDAFVSCGQASCSSACQ